MLKTGTVTVPVFRTLASPDLTPEDVINHYGDYVFIAFDVYVQVRARGIGHVAVTLIVASALVIVITVIATTAIAVATIVVMFPPGNTLTMVSKPVLGIVDASCFAGWVRRTLIFRLVSGG